MAKSAREAKVYENIPKPLYTYLLISVVAVVVVAGAYVNRDAITGFVTSADSSNTSGGSYTQSIAEFVNSGNDSDSDISVLTEPDCAVGCSRACWLIASSQPEGTSLSSQGKIGILGCDGNCWYVAETVENSRCCRNADCSAGKLCRNGVCIE